MPKRTAGEVPAAVEEVPSAEVAKGIAANRRRKAVDRAVAARFMRLPGADRGCAPAEKTGPSPRPPRHSQHGRVPDIALAGSAKERQRADRNPTCPFPWRQRETAGDRSRANGVPWDIPPPCRDGKLLANPAGAGPGRGREGRSLGRSDRGATNPRGGRRARRPGE